jgi:hypothetical protein
MTTTKLTGEMFSQGGDNPENFLLRKSRSLQLLLAGSPTSAEADVTLPSTATEERSRSEKGDVCDPAQEKRTLANYLAGTPWKLDCMNLSRLQLRQKYKSEATSHRNMLRRAKVRGNIIHPLFYEFPDFLDYMGPKLFPSATLDRSDNSDPEYGPGKVRWADKTTQSNNRRNSLLFDAPDGNQYTTSELAKRHGVTPSAIRQRLQRGWNRQQTVAGSRSSPVVAPRASSTPAPPSCGREDSSST